MESFAQICTGNLAEGTEKLVQTEEKERPVGEFDHPAERGPDLVASTFTHDEVWK